MRAHSPMQMKNTYNISLAAMSDYEDRLNIYLLSTGTLPHLFIK